MATGTQASGVRTTRTGQAVIGLGTHTLNREQGPFVYDVWEPRAPSGAPPVLLVHGWGNSGAYWDGTAMHLAQTVKVIVPDLPGTGRSLPVHPAQDMFDQVSALGELLDELELDRVQIIGHSMGCAMSILLTDRHPDRVERLALASSAFVANQAQVIVYRAIMVGFKTAMAFRSNLWAKVPGMARSMGARYFYELPSDDMMLRLGLDEFLSLDLPTAEACADDAPDPRIPQAGSRLTCPVQLLIGRQDKVVPLASVPYTIDTIPNCEMHWIEQCGHLPMIEKADEYRAHLDNFLELGR